MTNILTRPRPVLWRTAAALLGGYLFASCGAVLLMAVQRGANAPDGAPADAMLGGALLGLALYAAAIVWAFGVRGTAKAWGGLLLGSALLGGGGALLLALQGGAP
jgi:hypothetical protein